MLSRSVQYGAARRAIRRGACAIGLAGVATAAAWGMGGGDPGAKGGGAGGGATDVTTPYVALGYNDLGMHCMNSDYSEMMILPPFNTLHAQVIRRGIEPSVVTSGVTVKYGVPGNTHSADKSNFWQHPQPLLGTPAPNIGITGSGLSGQMTVTADRDWSVIGIPIVPIDDMGRESPYNLAAITVVQNGQIVAQTRAVVPTSTEMSCNLCHNTAGVSTASDILSAHDRLHGTTLMDHRPVACANCHSTTRWARRAARDFQPLERDAQRARAEDGAGAPGQRVLRLPSRRPDQLPARCALGEPHRVHRLSRVDAGGRGATRRPWLDEPRCADCHNRAGFEFEPAGVLYRNAVGHGGVHCAACHSSPHAITPATTAADNLQANLLPGHPGKIDTCAVCHTQQPSDPFPHRRDD